MVLLEIKILNTTIERVLNQEFSAYGITYAQATVIGYLTVAKRQNAECAVCQRDIEYSLGLAHPTVSSLLKRMEEKGIIEMRVQENDRRYKAIFLTEKGREMSDIVREKIREVTAQLFTDVDAEKQQEITDLLPKLIRNLS